MFSYKSLPPFLLYSSSSPHLSAPSRWPGVQILFWGISSIRLPTLVLCLEALLSNVATGASYTAPNYFVQLEDSEIPQMDTEDTRNQMSVQNQSW